MCDVIGDQVVAKRIALVHRTPQLARLGIDRESAAGIANAVGIYTQLTLLRIAGQNIRAILLPGIGLGVVHVRLRADRDNQFLAIGREVERARPMPAGGEIGNVLGRAA